MGVRAKPGRRGRTQTQPSETGVAARIRHLGRPRRLRKRTAPPPVPCAASPGGRHARNRHARRPIPRGAAAEATKPPVQPKGGRVGIHVTESQGALHAGAVAPRGPRGGLRMVPRAASASSAPRSATQRRAWVLPSLGGRMLRTGWGVGGAVGRSDRFEPGAIFRWGPGQRWEWCVSWWASRWPPKCSKNPKYGQLDTHQKKK